MNNKKVELKEQGDWFLFCQSYLYLSQLGCVQMLTNKLETAVSPYGFERNLYLATLYNFKHALEIIIKRLHIIGFEERPSKEHDLKELFEVLTNRALKIRPEYIKGEMKKAILNMPNIINKEYQDEAIDKQLEKFTASYSHWLIELEKLVNRYYYLEFLNEKTAGSFTFQDSQNTDFRYPDVIDVRLTYDDILKRIERKDIEKMLLDIQITGAVLNTLNIVFHMFPRKVHD